MKYKIIHENSPEKLEAAVNGLLVKGWKLQGELQVLAKGKETLWVQSLVHPNANP
jgi:hypothetical protein